MNNMSSGSNTSSSNIESPDISLSGTDVLCLSAEVLTVPSSIHPGDIPNRIVVFGFSIVNDESNKDPPMNITRNRLGELVQTLQHTVELVHYTLNYYASAACLSDCDACKKEWSEIVSDVMQTFATNEVTRFFRNAADTPSSRDPDLGARRIVSVTRSWNSQDIKFGHKAFVGSSAPDVVKLRTENFEKYLLSKSITPFSANWNIIEAIHHGRDAKYCIRQLNALRIGRPLSLLQCSWQSDFPALPERDNQTLEGILQSLADRVHERIKKSESFETLPDWEDDLGFHRARLVRVASKALYSRLHRPPVPPFPGTQPSIDPSLQ